jgi:DNA-binding NarL/FixJ family response regulator
MNRDSKPNSPKRAMIVDDTPATARAIRAFLESELATEVSGVAHTGEKAIDLARQAQPDLALIDLIMPGLSGLEVAQRIHAVSPSTRIIIVTALGEDMSDTCRRAGVEGFVVKNRLQEMLPSEISRIFAAQTR